jgi:CubicO group peptidase (beta-lactamase class C family)
VKNKYDNRIFKKLKRAKVNQEKTYKYSGIASLIYPKLIENITHKDYRDYLYTNFYNPLGCNTIRYLPNQQLTIVPTEIDTLFRKTLIKGYVHDENAALLGGISGNAGLFSNAHDLAIIMQMLVNKGVYDGRRYLKSETIEEFIKIQFPKNNNRRGLGFDKPLINNHNLSITQAYPAPQVSKNSFGHGGFTGTFVWADPDYNLVFVFLSNRVYPSRSHRNIYNLNISPKLQEVFYKELNLN